MNNISQTLIIIRCSIPFEYGKVKLQIKAASGEYGSSSYHRRSILRGLSPAKLLLPLFARLHLFDQCLQNLFGEEAIKDLYGVFSHCCPSGPSSTLRPPERLRERTSPPLSKQFPGASCSSHERSIQNLHAAHGIDGRRSIRHRRLANKNRVHDLIRKIWK